MANNLLVLFGSIAVFVQCHIGEELIQNLPLEVSTSEEHLGPSWRGSEDCGVVEKSVGPSSEMQSATFDFEKDIRDFLDHDKSDVNTNDALASLFFKGFHSVQCVWVFLLKHETDIGAIGLALVALAGVFLVCQISKAIVGH
jgi:hypothetical protein